MTKNEWLIHKLNIFSSQFSLKQSSSHMMFNDIFRNPDQVI